MDHERGAGNGRGPRAESGGGGTRVGVLAGLGLQFAVSIVLFLLLGQWLDRKLGTAPWLMIGCLFLGAGGTFFSIYRRLMRDLEREEAARRAARRGPTSPGGQA